MLCQMAGFLMEKVIGSWFIWLAFLIRSRFSVSVVKIITHFYKEYFVKYEVIKYPISFLRNISCLFQEIHSKCFCSLLKFFVTFSVVSKVWENVLVNNVWKEKVYFNKNFINVWFVLLLELKRRGKFCKIRVSSPKQFALLMSSWNMWHS